MTSSSVSDSVSGTMNTVTVLTPSGRGAVATIRVAGRPQLIDMSPALFSAVNGRAVAKLTLGQVCFGRWGEESPEDVVVCRVSEEQLEIHCHGGDAAIARIVGDLEARGCLHRQSGESRALLSPVARDLIEHECREALMRATTVQTADILWQQCEGRLAGVFDELEALPADRAKRRASELLYWAEFGRHLTQPWKVVLCGRPNVGKSSLINALVGYGRSIVFDQPGTTRDVVSVETAFDGWPVELSDTAGLRDDADALEAVGITRAREMLAAADLGILLLDTSQPPQGDDRLLLSAWPDALVVGHKSDLPNVWGDELPASALSVSSATGEGVDALAAAIVERLVPKVPSPLTPIPVTQRQVETLTRFLVADSDE